MGKQNKKLRHFIDQNKRTYTEQENNNGIKDGIKQLLTALQLNS